MTYRSTRPGKQCLKPANSFWHFDLLQFSSVQSVVSDSLQPGLQHARPPCPSPTPGVYSNSCPLSRWCHPTSSSSAALFFCPQSFPASGSYLMSQFFASGGQSIGVSALASVLPKNTHGWSPLEWTGKISLQSKGLAKSLLQHHSSNASILRCSAFFKICISPPQRKLWSFIERHWRRTK